MIALLGPTSSGKTSMALKLAEKFGMDIISCDSRQIYKYFDVGTGKRPVDQSAKLEQIEDYHILNGQRIYGYDLISPFDKYSAVDFRKYSKDVEKRIFDRKRIPLLVGGTGFYAEAALSTGGQLSEISNKSSSVDGLDKLTILELRAILPNSYISQLNNSELNNKQRLIRKVALYKTDGSLPTEKWKVNESSMIIFSASNEFLYSSADKWVDNIFDELIIEVKYLAKSGYRKTIPMTGIVYKTAIEYVDGLIQKDDCITRIKFDLHSYIRRQKTWFNRYKEADIVDISSDNAYNEVVCLVQKKIRCKITK